MNDGKRKIPYEDSLNVKKSKASWEHFCGEAWQQELIIMVKDECDLMINMDISGLICEYSLGYWVNCNDCITLTDPGHCEWTYTRNWIGWRCWMCDDAICGRKQSVYDFEFE